mmetsp:Transcript_22224/g.37832  ORF Transcript_22224/g.37832 Transcript_22224/m.37832 type:complete len:233 (-) Transcript_22224:2128-2826(-)
MIAHWKIRFVKGSPRKPFKPMRWLLWMRRKLWKRNHSGSNRDALVCVCVFWSYLLLLLLFLSLLADPAAAAAAPQKSKTPFQQQHPLFPRFRAQNPPKYPLSFLPYHRPYRRNPARRRLQLLPYHLRASKVSLICTRQNKRWTSQYRESMCSAALRHFSLTSLAARILPTHQMRLGTQPTNIQSSYDPTLQSNAEMMAALKIIASFMGVTMVFMHKEPTLEWRYSTMSLSRE